MQYMVVFQIVYPNTVKLEKQRMRERLENGKRKA